MGFTLYRFYKYNCPDRRQAEYIFSIRGAAVIASNVFLYMFCEKFMLYDIMFTLCKKQVCLGKEVDMANSFL